MRFLKTRSLSAKGKLVLHLAFLFALVFFVSACEDDDNNGNRLYENGAFVVNEGAWGANNASVSFISYEDGIVTEDLFKAANGSEAKLGDVLMDLDVVGRDVYMVLNTSNKVQVVNKDDFSWTTTIEGLDNPRYAEPFNGKLYVTQWGNGGSVAVIDQASNTVESTIGVGNGPEGILVYDNLLWVANSGGYTKDNSVSVIDPATKTVVKTIEVADNPQHMVIDANGDVWVVCFGYLQYATEPPYGIEQETPSALVRIDAGTKTVEKTITIHNNEHPAYIGVSTDGQTLYVGGGYTYNGIYAVSIDADSYPATKFADGNFYGFSVNPANGDLYGCQAPSFTKAGTVVVLDANTGAVKSSYNDGIGIGPRKVVF